MTPLLAASTLDALARSSNPVRSLEGDHVVPAELIEGAARVAERLRQGGLHPDEPVVVTIRNRPADLAALLGVWSAGGVAVPVHAAAASSTLEGVRVATAARLSATGDSVSSSDAPPPPSRPLLRGAALIVFTSGSTGTPKGVVIGHKAFAGKLDVLRSLLNLHDSDQVVVPLQLTFIFGLWVSLLSLRTGSSLVLASRFSAEATSKALRDGGSVLAAVPSMLRALVAARTGDAPWLRLILTGGEALGTALPGALGSLFPGAGVFDLYGLTETGSCDFCLSPDDATDGIGSIGHPTADVDYRIWGPDGRPAPGGEGGELQIKTPFGMAGYLDNPDLTASSFIDGFFRTGDLARRRPDGRVALVGRSKEMISRGGNKIAPLEIDNLLASHPQVAAALCAGVPDERLGEAIHAVVVLAEGATLTGEELRIWVGTQVERYKIPDRIMIADALPVGGTGKASRSAIVAMAREE